MVIFKYELRNHAKYIFTWAIALAVCIFLMIPVYYSLLNGAESSANPLYETLGSSDFFQSTGVSMEYLTAPDELLYAGLRDFGYALWNFYTYQRIFGENIGIPVYKTTYPQGNILCKGVDSIVRRSDCQHIFYSSVGVVPLPVPAWF